MKGVINHFNRGVIDSDAMARDDLKRVNNSAEVMENFIPMRLGPMMYRPGFEYISTLSSADHYLVPFVTTVDNPTMLDFIDGSVQFIVDDAAVQTEAVTTTITNGSFNSDITGWTDASAGSGAISWYTGSMAIVGDGSSNGSASQTLTTQIGVSHFLKIVINRASCVVKIGTSGAGSYDIYSGDLKVGTHVLNITPDSNMTITFENAKTYQSLIDSVEFLGAGTLSLGLDSFTLSTLRYRQSIDVMFCAADGVKPFQIERRGDKSWSVVEYLANDGPFSYVNSSNIALTPAAISGDTTLTASGDYFSADDIGRLFKLVSSGQSVSADVSVDTGAGTSSIRVTGVGDSRIFNIGASFSAVPSGHTVTVTLQRSTDNALWEDIETYTEGTSKSFNDEFDNSILYYRLFVKAGDNGFDDTVSLSLTYSGGEIEGVARVTEFNSPTNVDIQVVSDFGGLNATLDWYAGDWHIGSYPTAVDIYEGRVWYGRNNSVYGSVSDSYYSHDADIEGDSSAIKKTVGFGAVSSLKWLKSGYRMILGTLLDEITIRSSSYGEVLTAANANIKSGTNQGSDDVDPIMIDNVVYFVQRSGVKLYSLVTFAERDDSVSSDVNLLNKSITSSGIVRIAFSHQPETRIWCVLGNGDLAIHTMDVSEEVAAWSLLSVDGDVKDVIALPGNSEDQVYIVVERDGESLLLKLGSFSDASTNANDFHVMYSGVGSTLSGLDHLEGETVRVISDNVLRGEYVVSGGSVNIGRSSSVACAGLAYEANYKSSKLSGYRDGTVLTGRKRVMDTGIVLLDYFHEALTIGPTTNHMKPIPRIKRGIAQVDSEFIAEYSELPFPFDGNTESDPRIHVKATAPCKLLALTYDIENLEQSQKQN